MTLEYKVPRLLWENLEAVLLAQSRRYISELAKYLGVSEKELQKRVMPTSDSLKITLHDSHSESNQCHAYIQQDQLTTFCRKPVAYHSEFCTVHRANRMTVIDASEATVVQKIKDTNMMGAMWALNRTLINSNGEIIGNINKYTNVIKRFKIVE